MTKYSCMLTLGLFLIGLAPTGFGQNTLPVVGRNVNMVSGLTLADGDPFLTKQNEPSIAVSSANPLHLLAGSNDYRLVDLAQSLDDPEGGDSWVSLFKSIDGGRTWRSTVISGCPLNIAACNSPLAEDVKGRQYASDPVVRSGPYGTFFYSFLAGNRGTGAGSMIAVQRFFDMNNAVKVSDDPFRADVMNILSTGTPRQMKDKPWNAVDIPGRSWNRGDTCALPNYRARVPAFNVYVAYSNFRGQDPDDPRAEIDISVSDDCGATFPKVRKVSESIPTNQAPVLTIDPTTGAVYVFWRQIRTAANKTADGIYSSKSTDGGESWSEPRLVAQIRPFDQNTSLGSFRSLAFPTAAVSVDAGGERRVHVAWSQLGVGPTPGGTAPGAARIVMTTSENGGATWTMPTPVDNSFQKQAVPYAGGQQWSSFNTFNAAGYGHQFQPSMTFAAGKLTLVWVDQRLDHTVGALNCPSTPGHSIAQCPEVRTPATGPDTPAAVFSAFINDAGLNHRHSLDIFGGQALPADQPSFAVTRLSQYSFGSPRVAISPGGIRTPQPVKQLQFNAPNLPIYVNGTTPFLGDYTDVAAQQMIPTGNPAKPYAWNISPANKTAFHATWTDNRDIIRPFDGNWQNYTPIKLLSSGGTNVVQNPNCNTGQAGMRNQNIYTARLFDGIDAYAVSNSKYLLSRAPRQFNVVVVNGTGQIQPVSLQIVTPLPPGVSAGFKPNLTIQSDNNVSILPASSVTRTVWITSSSNPGATVTVNVTGGGTVIPVVLNPDPAATTATANPAPDVTINGQSQVSVLVNRLSNNDLTNNDLTNNDLTNNDLTNNDLTNNDLTNNDLTNAAVINNDLTNNDLTNNDLTNNDLTNNDLTNNDLTNNDLTNAGLVDSTFTMFNNGTTDVALDIKTLLKGVTNGKVPPGYKAQLIVHGNYVTQLPDLSKLKSACGYAKSQQNFTFLNVPTPNLIISNPDASLGQVQLDDPYTVALKPQEIVRVTYRLINISTGDLNTNQNAAIDLASNGLKSIAVNSSTTTVPIPLVITTQALAPATYGQAASYQFQSIGGLAPISWSLVGALPPGFTFSPAGLLSSSSPFASAAGQYTFKVQASDSGNSCSPTYRAPCQQTDSQTFTLVVIGALPVVTVSGGTFPYDGQPHPATGTVTGVGGVPLGPLSFTYNGSPTVPVNAGSYAVVASFPANGNYIAASSTAAIVINLATPIVSVNGGTFNYDGSAHSANGTVTGVGGAALGTPIFTYTPGGSNSPVNVGYYSVTGSYPGSLNYTAATSSPKTITITPNAFDISDFSSLALIGSPPGTVPMVIGSKLRMSTSTGQTSAAWYPAKQSVANGFTTEFQFQISAVGEGQSIADGFAFVIQNSAAAANALGTTNAGGFLGYEGILNSLAVEFDTFQNQWDPNNNHVAIQSNGMLANTANHGTLTPGVHVLNAGIVTNMSDGNSHSVKITYDGSDLVVFLDGTSVLTVPVNLRTLLALDTGGRAILGFTAATGADAENTDILNWRFTAN